MAFRLVRRTRTVVLVVYAASTPFGLVWAVPE
jgi:hypothetical protein